MLLGPVATLASTRHVVLAVHGSSPAGKTMAANLARMVPGCQTAELSPSWIIPPKAVLLAIGPEVLSGLLANRVAAPIISLFTSQSTFSRLAADPDLTYQGRQVTAIYAETSTQSQLELVADIYRRRVSVGLPLSIPTPNMAALERQAKTLNLELQTRTLRPGETLASAANELRVDVILLTPEAGQLTSELVRALLESTYRRAQPVIGYTAGLVAAGTVASTHATVEDVAAQLPDLVEQIDSGRLPPPGYPSHWRVATNPTVARSLDIVLPATLTGIAR